MNLLCSFINIFRDERYYFKLVIEYFVKFNMASYKLNKVKPCCSGMKIVMNFDLRPLSLYTYMFSQPSSVSYNHLLYSYTDALILSCIPSHCKCYHLTCAQLNHKMIQCICKIKSYHLTSRIR